MGVFTMPSLGADMDSGRIVEWLVQPGDMVRRGDVVAVVDTTKAAIEVEVFENGKVTELLVQPGTEVEVGTPLATIQTEVGDSDVAADSHPDHAHQVAAKATPPVRHLAHQLGVNLESLAGSGPQGKITRKDVESAAHAEDRVEPSTQRDETRGTESEQVHAETATPHPQPHREPLPELERETGTYSTQSVLSTGGRIRATPRARRAAAQQGIDLASIDGTGADGAITGPDVEKAAGESDHHSVSDDSGVVPNRIATGEERRAMRRTAIAKLMARSGREIPHYYVSQTVELTHTLDWLRSHNAELSVRNRVLPAAMFLRATVQAAQQVTELNGHWVNDTFVPADGVQLGVAVAMRDGGLLTPAIIDSHLLDLDELMAHLTDIVRRARSGKLRSREIAPGSITVSSLADGGPDALFGVIYPPQVALVGIGGVAERPWAVDGVLAARPTVTLTIAADHRATDGRIGAKFLAALSSALTRPEEM